MDDNASWLFERPSKAFHNSEKWWSSLFSFLLLHLAQSGLDVIIPIYRYDQDERTWRFSKIQNAKLDYRNLTFLNIVIDGKLTETPFGLDQWPVVFLDIRPDIMLICRDEKRFVFIEVKTTEQLKIGQIERYGEAVKHLEAQGWRGDSLYLVSGGNVDSQATYIAKHNVRLILWEDVIRIIDDIPHLRSIFSGVELKQFYARVPMEGMI